MWSQNDLYLSKTCLKYMVSFYEWKYPKSSSIWSTMPHQIVWTKSAYLGKYLKSGIATGIKHSFFELFFISRILSHGLWHLLTKLETRCGHQLIFLCLLLKNWILLIIKDDIALFRVSLLFSNSICLEAIGPWKRAFWSDRAPFKGPQPRLVHCFRNSRVKRTPHGV